MSSPFRKPPRWTQAQVAACITVEGAATFVLDTAKSKRRLARPPLPPLGHPVRQRCFHAPLHALPWRFDFKCFCGATCRELLEAQGLRPISFDDVAIESIEAAVLRAGRTGIQANAIERLAHEAQWRASQEGPSTHGGTGALKDLMTLADASRLATDDFLSIGERQAIKKSLRPLLHVVLFRLLQERPTKKGRRRTLRTHLGCLLEEFLREAGLVEAVAADLFAAGIQAATGDVVQDPLREMRLARGGRRSIRLVGSFMETDRDLLEAFPRWRKKAGPAIDHFLRSCAGGQRFSAALRELRAAVAAT